MAKVKIKKFDLQNGTDRTVFATWTWSKSYTDYYRVKWYYSTGDGVWFLASDSNVEVKQATYNAPSNATGVKFLVKPYSKKKTVNGKETSRWTADWSTTKYYYFSSNPPTKPDAPTVTIEKLKLTASIDNYDGNAKYIEFRVVKNDKTVVKKGKAAIKTKAASWTCSLSAGNSYKVRCRAVKGKEYSDWTDYVDAGETMPATPKWNKARAESETSVYLDWNTISTHKTYEVQYTTDEQYFKYDRNPEAIHDAGPYESSVGIVEGLTSGDEYFFRVRAVNDDSVAGNWSEIISVIVGKAPSAPTTWSSTTTAVVGEPLNLYWIHNSEDGSTQTSALLTLIVNGVASDPIEIPKTVPEGEEEETSVYPIDTTAYSEGAKLEWYVTTKGILDEYSEASVQRTIDIYSPPVLESFGVTNADGELIDVVESFPIYITGVASPDTQTPIGYYISITSNEAYESVDDLGNLKMISAGDELYSGHFDITGDSILLELTPGHVNLDNNKTYTVTGILSMDSGLTAMASDEFEVAWIDEEYEIDAEIAFDEDDLTVHIRPYCGYYNTISYTVESYIDDEDNTIYEWRDLDTPFTDEVVDENMTIVEDAFTEEDGLQVYIDSTSNQYLCFVPENLIDPDAEMLLPDDVTLSVYRREYDGSFTKLQEDTNNANNTFITDPHPALDYARYRVVATSDTTGAISYYDVPGYPIGEKAVIIQWDEAWSNFDVSSEDVLEEPSWAGSMLKLPYNIDVSDKHQPDVALVEYIGRNHPVSYYGTQLGVSSTWNVSIAKDDEETLYGLRRLARYMGDVYVREPSGSGYWANITVSFSQKHCELTIPVTLDITRVEGGA